MGCKILRLIAFVALLANLQIISHKAFAANSDNLTIFAETSMVYALTDIARNYSKENNVVVSINFNSPFELIQNIDSGEPADIFISSHHDWIENLKQKGLVDVYNISNIARDHLLLVTSNSNTKIKPDIDLQNSNLAAIFKIINNNDIPLIIGSEYTSLGRYTSEIIKGYNINKNNIYKKINEDKRSIIDFLNKNNSYCGIVLESEIGKQKNIRILAEVSNPDIYYQALVVAGDNMERARDFLKYLRSDSAKSIFVSRGFIIE